MTRVILSLFCLLAYPAWAVDFSSSDEKTTVVELYTSEGCSSCPPADRWLSSLKNDPRLFKTLLPMAFHVDYWDQLGWPDRFAMEAYSQRQRQLVREDILSQVYTPGIVVDSSEWRGWFNGQRKVTSVSKQASVLSASYQDGELAVSYPDKNSYELNIAILGIGLKTNVEAGENRGRFLSHDFVVLSLTQQTGQQQWNVSLSDLPELGQQQTALAIWLTRPDSLEVVQAAATYLDIKHRN